jgi:asparagine synthase (glutamine-hydrolysing)
MQRETGPFPIDGWESGQGPRFATAASAQQVSGDCGIAQDSTRSLTVVFDGVIFNREEVALDAGLSEYVETCGRGHGRNQEARALLKDEPPSDADLLLAGYRCWGRDVFDQLIGDFAFAIWDDAAGTLFAAVDHFGLRPLYFSASNGRLAFASRMKKLRLLPWVGSTLNDRMIVSILLDSFKDPWATFYSNIRQLPAGNLLWADGKRATVSRYWRPGERNECTATRPEEVLVEFADRFRQAVKQRLDPTQPTGILMSGGLDSTAMAGMTAQIYRREPSVVPPVSIISAVFGDLSCDESSYINAVLRRLPFANQEIDGRNGIYTLNDLQSDMNRHEWPVLHRQGPLFNAFREAARACGARILLNGSGGDELTTDYRYYAVPMNGANPLGILRAAHLVRQVEKLPLGRALHLLAREACPEEIKRPYRWVRRLLLPKKAPTWSSWLAPKFWNIAEELDAPEACSKNGFGSETLDLAWRILTAPGASWSNRFLSDAFAAAGIQCRFPYLDRRLFDLVFSVPPHLRPRCRGGPWFKPYISQGLSAFIPREIRLRDAKVDFEDYNCLVFDRCLEFFRPNLFDDGQWNSEDFVPRLEALAFFRSISQEIADKNRKGPGKRKRTETLRNIAGLELWLRESDR